MTDHKPFEVGNSISVNFGGAVAHSAVACSFVHGTIEAVTQKAIKVRNDKGFTWFPKSAIKPAGTDWFQVAKWFRPSNPVFVERMMSHNGVSV